ncbi:MAG: hypothetical protein F6K22_29290 [Okeania sp. SIO2F4]|nr:hypothetical protein [Okeania sp. SIO2F4]
MYRFINQRFNVVVKHLKTLNEKLYRFEKALNISSSEEKKFELETTIKQEILPRICRYEAEYWALYPQKDMEAIIISDHEAQPKLLQIEQAVESIEYIPNTEYPHKLLLLLQDIRAKLDDLDKSAAAKLKAALPLIPAIVSYELEMDTEGVMYKTWKGISNLLRR